MAPKRLLATAFLAALAPIAASAASYTFDLASETSIYDPAGDPGTFLNDYTLSITDGGLTGIFGGGYVTGLSYDGSDTVDGGTFQDADRLRRFNNGLGVCNVGECYSEDPVHSVDGASSNTRDYVELSFYSGGELVDVTLTALTFGWIGEWTWGGHDLGFEDTDGSFEILLDTMTGGDIGLGDQLAFSGTVTANLDSYLSRGSFNLADENLFDSVFGIMAGDMASWKLLAVTVDFTPPPPPPPPEIPLPGAIWLMLGALGGLAGLRRLRTA
ncbi:hypothetical protein GQ651_07475 [Alphaproteobacteria bacterium GH1-50]|uniref:Secreted protein n=1 Tax=Kangsaoukella pontilimi TaxID=2691042 RepID=A0A7C9IQG6_9RHOB|nr:hypothetical protein [Kangsaoukella pontilimi]MXQ07683.1 hypothetical protein [Kangsaoukella pontilimi]